MSGNPLRKCGATKYTQNRVVRAHRKKILLRTRNRSKKNESPTALPLYQSNFTTVIVSLVLKAVALRTCLPVQCLFRLVCVCIQRSNYRHLPITCLLTYMYMYTYKYNFTHTFTRTHARIHVYFLSHT